MRKHKRLRVKDQEKDFGARKVQIIIHSFLIPSRRVSIIVVKHSTEPLAPTDRSCLFRDTLDWNNEPIPEPLIVPFGMIMCHEIVSCISQRILAKEDHLLQARFLNSSDEPFRERIQIWGSRWQFDGLDTRVRKTG